MASPDSPAAPEAQPALVSDPAGSPQWSDSPTPDWPAWTAPIALITGILMALVGSLLVDIPAAIGGVTIDSNNLAPGLQIADTFVQDLAFVGAAVLLAGWGGRRVYAWQFGLRPAPLRRSALLVVGTVLAFLLFAGLWGQVVSVKPEKILDQLGANRSDVLLVLSALLTCMVAPVCEELLFRGYIFSALRNWKTLLGGGPWPAAVVTGLLFGAVHAASAPALDLVPLAVLGFALCLLYWRTGSLLPSMAAHSLNNCIAFGGLEHWDWQIPVLMLASLSLIALLFAGLTRAGLIGWPAPAPA